MNRIIITLISLFFSTMIIGQDLIVEPPSWWSGMKHSQLQLLIKADKAGSMEVKIYHSTVKLVSVDKGR